MEAGATLLALGEEGGETSLAGKGVLVAVLHLLAGRAKREWAEAFQAVNIQEQMCL